MTTRSFLKRLNALVRYRQALKDMDQYPDASAEDLERENTCIICREEMRPWDPADPSQVERTRAKKLPCGHILHFGCLKSWLERQQVCPTCRRPVTREGEQPARNGQVVAFRLGVGFPAGQNRQGQPPADGQAPAAQAPNDQENNQNQNQNWPVRMFNIGPIRLGIAQGRVNDIMAQRLGLPADAGEIAPPAEAPVATPPAPAQSNPNDLTLSVEHLRTQLLEVGHRVQQEMQALHNTAHEINAMSLLLNEIHRLQQLQQHLRDARNQGQTPQGTPPVGTPTIPGMPAGQLPLPHLPPPIAPVIMPLVPPRQFGQPVHPLGPRLPSAGFTRHGATNYGAAIPAGSSDLPEGVVIPPGWSLLPLHRLEGGVPPADSVSHAPLQETYQGVQQPRSNPAPTAAGSEQGDWTEVTIPSIPDTAQVSETRNTASPRPAAATGDQQTAAPAVTAPTPLAPSWGGSAQMFNAQGTPGTFRLQDEAGESSSSQVPQGRTGSERAAATESKQNMAADSKGKARSATVEEAEDDEDE